MSAAITIFSICLSIAALAFSIYVFVDSHARDRRDVFSKIHEILISDELQRARYVLFDKVTDEASVVQLSASDFRDVNRALATYNTLGFYCQKGYVSEREVIEIWGRSLMRAWHAFQPFLAYREKRHGFAPVEYYRALAHKAETDLSGHGIPIDMIASRHARRADPDS
jgi:hypothetical protein